VIDLSRYGEKYGENHIYTLADIDRATSKDLERKTNKEISQTHSEAVIARGYNRGTSWDG